MSRRTKAVAEGDLRGPPPPRSGSRSTPVDIESEECAGALRSLLVHDVDHVTGRNDSFKVPHEAEVAR